jgi:hypothetical protein
MTDREITVGMAAAVQAGALHPILLAKIGTAGGDVRVWSGGGTIQFGGEAYAGTGVLGSVSPIQEGDGLQATGVTFQLSGVDPSLISTALGQMRNGMPAKLWFGVLGDDLVLVADPLLLFEGLTDVPVLQDDGATATIGITAESRLIDLERPRTRRYTAEDQALDDASDKGFEYVPAIQDMEIIFGRS